MVTYIRLNPRYANQGSPGETLGCASGGSSNETPIVLWEFDQTNNQKWAIENNSYLGQACTLFYPKHATTKAFDSNNGTGNAVWLWTRDNTNPNQLWVWDAVSGTSDWFYWRRVSDGAYLTGSGTSWGSGLTVQSTGGTGSTMQQFNFRAMGISDECPDPLQFAPTAATRARWAGLAKKGGKGSPKSKAAPAKKAAAKKKKAPAKKTAAKKTKKAPAKKTKAAKKKAPAKKTKASKGKGAAKKTAKKKAPASKKKAKSTTKKTAKK